MPDTLAFRLLRFMGATGCIRGWRLTRLACPDQATWTGNSPRVQWRKLEQAGYIGKALSGEARLRWHFRQGRGRPLYDLTPAGRDWYRQRTDAEPAESELPWVLSHHVSVRHAVAILEARDHLLALGIPVDDQPPLCPERADDPWGIRAEPDLAVYYRERVWPVEVQRDIRMSNLSKWVKSLELFQRLMLVTFCVDRLERQCRMLAEARAQCRLPDHPVLLASLEGWEGGDSHFLSV